MLLFNTRGRYYSLHSNMCSTKGRVLPGLFVFARISGGRGGDDVGATDREACETKELSTLQSGKNRRERALPAVPVQTAATHAAATGRDRQSRRVGGGQRTPRRRQLLRHPV